MTDFFDWLTVNDYGLGTDRLADAFKLSRRRCARPRKRSPRPYAGDAAGDVDPDAWSEVSRRFLPFAARAPRHPGRTSRKAGPRGTSSSDLFGSQDIIWTVARKVSTMSDVTPDTVEKLMRSLSVMSDRDHDEDDAGQHGAPAARGVRGGQQAGRHGGDDAAQRQRHGSVRPPLRRTGAAAADGHAADAGDRLSAEACFPTR